MSMNFRYLTDAEVEARISTVTPNGCSALLYKDARCDMRILDETVGAENWQREHYECKNRYDEFRMFPVYEKLYRRAFGRMLEARKEKGKPTIWKTADDVFRWWMDDKNLDGQLDFFGGEIGKENEQ